MSLVTPTLDDSFHILHEKAHEFVTDKQQELESEYGFGQHDGYQVNWEQSTITFFKQQIEVITFQFQVVGYLNEQSNKWTWRWHEPLEASEQTELDIIRNYGDFYDFTFLTQPELKADAALAWAFTAISAYLRGAKGVFRIPQENTAQFVYLQLPPQI